MDMKKILQALDGASQKPVEGSSDMKKFVQIVNEGTNPHKVSLPVQMAMNHYQKPKKEKLEEVSVFKTYVAVVEDELNTQQAERKQLIRQYSQRIAESVLKKNVSERVVPGQETPPGINRLTGKPFEPEATATAPAEKPVALSIRFDPRFKNGPEPYTIDIDGKIYKFAGRDKQGPGTGEIIKIPAAAIGIRGLGAVSVELGADGLYYPAPKVDEEGDADPGISVNKENEFHAKLDNLVHDTFGKRKDELGESKETVKVPVTQKPRQGPLRPQTGAGAHKDKKKDQKQGKEKHKKPFYELADVDALVDALDEAKKTLKNSNPCWKGYKPVGTKKKNGKTVPNCVPKESVEEAKKKPNATTRHLKDYPVSDKDVARPVKKPEKKKPEQGVAEAISAAQQAAIAIAKKKKVKK